MLCEWSSQPSHVLSSIHKDMRTSTGCFYAVFFVALADTSVCICTTSTGSVVLQHIKINSQFLLKTSRTTQNFVAAYISYLLAPPTSLILTPGLVQVAVTILYCNPLKGSKFSLCILEACCYRKHSHTSEVVCLCLSFSYLPSSGVVPVR